MTEAPAPAETGALAVAGDAAMLELDGVSVSYGRFRALFDVSLRVRAGGVSALVGPNGAGKSTVARVATGLVPASSGRVLVAGEDVTGLSAHEIARRGVAHVPEGRPVLASLDVEENLLLYFRAGLRARQAAEALARAYERFPRLAERRRQPAGTLSGGEQRMLALARVLAHPPRLLVVDELSFGLAPRAVDDVYRALAEVREAGTTLLVVEQHVPRALSLAEDLVVLRKGSVVHAGPAAGLAPRLGELLGGVEARGATRPDARPR